MGDIRNWQQAWCVASFILEKGVLGVGAGGDRRRFLAKESLTFAQDREGESTKGDVAILRSFWRQRLSRLDLWQAI